MGFLKRSIIEFLSWVDENSSLTLFAYLLFCWHLEVNKNLNKNPFGVSYLCAVGGGPSHVLQPQSAALNGTLFNSNEAQNELTCTLLGSRKRAREAATAATAAADMLANQRQQQQQQQQQLLNQQRQPQPQQQLEHQLLNVSDYRNHITGPVVMPPQSTGVSTGLRLTFEDDRLNSTTCASTSGRGNVCSTMFSIMGEDLSTQIQQQSEEIELLLKAQVVCLFVFLSPSTLFLSFTELDVYIYMLFHVQRGVQV